MAPNNTTPEEQRDRSGDRAAGAGPLIGGTVFVGVITACALVLSYHGLFQLAEYGGHEGSAFAHVFPVTYALIVLMAFWVSYVLRSAPPRDRLWVDVGLIPVLILFAGATMVARNLGLFDPQITGPLLSERVANVIVAVAPLAALLIAILLWITVRAHMRRRNRGAARPKPSADRTTVLPARRPAAEEPEPAPLKTRLFDLGQENRDEDDEDSTETERMPAVGAASERDGEEADPVADTHAFARPEETEEPEEPDEVRSEAPAEVDPPEEPEPEPEPEPAEARSEPGPEAGSLPRRTGGDNPIKRAADQAPVVPGAAPLHEPGSASGEDAAFHPVVVPDHLADEGFEHQSPVGDPVTDEAEAPREEAPYAGADPAGTATESSAESTSGPERAPARAEAAPPVRAVGTFETPTHDPALDTDPVDPARPEEGRPEPDAGEAAAGPVPDAAPAGHGTAPADPGSVAETAEPAPDVPSTVASAPSEAPSAPDHSPEEAPVASAGLDGEGDGGPGAPAPEPADESTDGPALWEPPTEETGGNLDDYVPPVWTPPEDDGPLAGTAVGEPEGPEVTDGPVPALDHDTGPEVRAAFGRPAAVPPGASLPEEPEAHDHATAAEEHDRSGPEDAESAPEPTELEEPAEPTEPEEPSESVSDALPEEPADDGDAVRRTTPPPRETPPPLRRTPPPPAKPRSSPAAQALDARSLRKRPMVLKPRRPPIPDLNSGPPSRQVRSEPMRPED